MSKASRNGSDEPSAKRRKKTPSESPGFVRVLTEGGLQLRGESNEFEVRDPVQLRRFLEKKLGFDVATAQEFQTSLAAYLQDAGNLRRALLPTAAAPSNASSSQLQSTAHSHDSLIKILLSVEAIQPALITLLLQRLPQFSGEQAGISDQFGENMPKMILSQFRWLDRIVDSSQLTQQLLETMEVCSPDLQKDIIAVIPEIVDDEAHETVVDSLSRVMSQDAFTVTVLDAMSNLSLRPDLLDKARHYALDMLQSSGVDALPVIIRFILQSVTSKNAAKVVKEMRENLQIETLAADEDDSELLSQRHTSKANAAKAAENLLFESLKSGLRFSKEVTTAFFKELQKATEYRILDVWIMLALYSMGGSWRKSVDSLIRKKIAAGQFTEKLLKESVQSHAEALRECFQLLLSLAESWLRAVDNVTRAFGGTLYALVFAVFADNYHRQEVLGSVVTHVGSGSVAEVDAALDMLLTLVESRPADVLPFTVFIRGILDYVCGLEDTQVRKAFRVFSALTAVETDKGDGLSSELFIMIRKLLSSSAVQFKRIGILGAIALIRNLNANAEQVRQVHNILDIVRVNTRKSYICTALLCDEAFQLLRSQPVDAKIVAFVKEHFTQDWQENFVESVKNHRDRKKLWMPLESKQRPAEVVINFFGRLLLDDPHARESVTCLAPQFKLVQLLVRGVPGLGASQHQASSSSSQGGGGGIDGGLQELSDVLAAPVALFDPDDLEVFGQVDQKEAECLGLFYCINWFRELVNAFSTQTRDPAAMQRVLQRLDNIVALEQHLDRCLAIWPQFTIPFSAKGTIRPKFPDAGKKKAKRKGKENEKEKDSEDSGAASKKDEQEGGVRQAYLAAVRPYLRELELDASLLLAWTDRMALDSQEELEGVRASAAGTVVEIELPVLRYLLEDLQAKLKTVVTVRKRASFLPTVNRAAEFLPTSLTSLSPMEALERLRPVFPALCAHLERVRNVIDEDVDDPSTQDMKRWAHLVPCLLLVFDCFEKLFSFDELYHGDQSLILGVLRAIAVERCGRTAEECGTMLVPELLEISFDYFSVFMKGVKEMRVAVALYNLLASMVRDRKQQAPLLDRLSTLAGELLQRRSWSEARPKAEHISLLLNEHIRNGIKPGQLIEHLSLDVLPAYLKTIDAGDEDFVSEYATLTKFTVPVYYKVLLQELVTLFAELDTTTGDETDEAELLATVALCVKIFQALTQLVKMKDQKTMLAICLRSGKVFVERFLKVMPFFSSQYAEHHAEIQEIFKNLQSSTRVLQVVCTHAKDTKDPTITALVPAVRKALEMLIFKVKVILTSNKRLGNFWLGQLKHKNIKGDEISSQVAASQEDDEVAAEEADEEPADGEEDAADDAPRQADDSDAEDDAAQTEAVQEEGGYESEEV